MSHGKKGCVLVFRKLKNRFLTPQIQNFDFNENLGRPENRICSVQLCTNNTCAKVQANIFAFGSAMAEKPGKVITSLF